MKDTLVSMRSTRLVSVLIPCLIVVLCLISPVHGLMAEPVEESPMLTSEDTPKLEDTQGMQTKAQEDSNVGVVYTSESLELVVEDANKNALANATVEILYSGRAVGSGVTGSDGRIRFTGLSKSVSFGISVFHETAGELALEFDGAESGFDDAVVLTLPKAAPPEAKGFFERLFSGAGSTNSRIVSIVLLAVSALEILRIIISLSLYEYRRRKSKKQLEQRMQMPENAEAAGVYKYAKHK